MLAALHRHRGMALLPLGALAVHQLRYLLAFGDGAESRLAAQGHAYLGSVAAVVVMLAAVALGGFFARLARSWRVSAVAPGACVAAGPPHPTARHGLLRLWALAALALAAIYCGQELLEGVLATGHPEGIAGVLGAGGWLALPLSALVGGAIALLLRGARAVLALVGRAARRHRLRPAGRLVHHARPADRRGPRRAPLAGAHAGRAPPAPSIA